jgi:TLC domain
MSSSTTSAPADYYLQTTVGLDPVTRTLLSGIAVLDQHGAWTWDLRLVALGTTLVLWLIRLVFQKKHGIDWYAFLHAIVSSVGALACLYLDWVASEPMTRVAEPLRSIALCAGPLTSLHRILPAITMGYSVFDLLDGLQISLSFALHGVATLAVMALFLHVVDAPHIVAPMLLMETSTIFLNLVHADFVPASAAVANQICFAVSFFVARLVLFPMIWIKLMGTMWQYRTNVTFQQCYPAHFMYTCFLFGMVFHTLNVYWFIKIVRKARRRMQGIEKHTERNDLADLSREENDCNHHNKKEKKI